MPFKRWTPIDPDRPETMPPLRENVLLFCSFSSERRWHFFTSEGQRVAVMKRFLFTHWREEMTTDSP